ncbi:11690_t:CDS:1 [Dentiscutata erythropus]|uniref:11690_t:CDS:1 n=1 Tax=Dentiscutata erythropus TaxID=1348616 RepID=A0A9N8VZ07_9GLOM|nr:11690_t:CDS:1 [Dentiscutata erythropus]
MKIITNHKKANHSKKACKQNTNQTFAQPSIESTTDTHLIFPSSSIVTYLSTEEVNASLDSLNTQQIELSNAAFWKTSPFYLLLIFHTNSTLLIYWRHFLIPNKIVSS